MVMDIYLLLVIEIKTHMYHTVHGDTKYSTRNIKANTIIQHHALYNKKCSKYSLYRCGSADILGGVVSKQMASYQ